MSQTGITPNPELWLEEHGDALYAFALLRVNDAAAAEDLVQETLLAALGAMAKFEGGASVRTWLIGILKNKIVDNLRKSWREVSIESSGDDDIWPDRFDATGHWLEPPTDWREPQRLAESEQLGQAMEHCISGLPKSLRTLFVLREVDGHETEELMELLSISTRNNLWVMLSRARERVRSCLDKSWFGKR